SWLVRHPVKVEVAGSSPVEVAVNGPDSQRIRAVSRVRDPAGIVTGITVLSLRRVLLRSLSRPKNFKYCLQSQGPSFRINALNSEKGLHWTRRSPVQPLRLHLKNKRNAWFRPRRAAAEYRRAGREPRPRGTGGARRAFE